MYTLGGIRGKSILVFKQSSLVSELTSNDEGKDYAKNSLHIMNQDSRKLTANRNMVPRLDQGQNRRAKTIDRAILLSCRLGMSGIRSGEG